MLTTYQLNAIYVSKRSLRQHCRAGSSKWKARRAPFVSRHAISSSLPNRNAHTVRDGPGSPARWLDELLAEQSLNAKGVFEYGGNGVNLRRTVPRKPARQSSAAVIRFVEEFGPALHKISRHFVADPRASGGSISRIYRDLRFSKDRRPYKTEMALHFWHRESKPGSQAPSYYLRLAPGECFVGGGMWQPDSATLKKVRAAIASQPKAWQSVHDAGLLIKGEVLKRPPPDYPSEHRFAADLMRKSFLISQPFTEKEVCISAFLTD